MLPNNTHQNAVELLYEIITLFVRLFALGKVRLAPFEVRLQPGGPSREPDILFLATEHLDRMTEERLVGAPDLVIEVVSNESVRRDRDEKVREYAAAGVREYWIIDPRPGKQRADFLHLDADGVYTLAATEDDERVPSLVLPGFWLRPAWLWGADTLNPLLCALEIDGVAAALSAQIQQAQQGAGKP
jgi:Uma2 family endonuclease